MIGLLMNAFSTLKKESTTIEDDIFKVRLEIQRKAKRDNSTGNQNLFYKHGTDGKREQHIKNILENLTQKPWVSCRPKWLKNPSLQKKIVQKSTKGGITT